MRDQTRLLNKVILISVIIFLTIAAILTYFGLKAAQEMEEQGKLRSADKILKLV